MNRLTQMVSVIPLLWSVAAVPLHGQVTNTDVVSEWNGIMLATVGGQNPFAQARSAAITQLAVFEAVNAITRDYKPYLGNIFTPPDASQEAAVIAAAHRVLWSYFPGNAITLDAARANSLAKIPDGPSKANGVAAGEAAATAMIELRSDDGSGTPMLYTPLTGAGFWQPTPPAFGPAILLHWGKMTPFGIARGDQFRSSQPPSLSSGKYARDYNEVKNVGGVGSPERSEDRANVARFYSAVNGVQAWNQAALQVLASRPGSLVERSRTLALLNIAISDALVSAMETKYFYHFWRPVTAIRAGER